MSGKINAVATACMTLATLLLYMAVPSNSARAGTPAWDLNERPQTLEELRVLVPWYLKDCQVLDGETAWNAIAPADGGYEAWKGSAAFTLPLADDARIDGSITIERGVSYEPTADDLARADASGLPVYGFTFDLTEMDGRTVMTMVSYIPEDVLEPTEVTAGIPGRRLPASSASGAEQCVKIVQEVANAASLVTTLSGAWDTMGQHERILRMIDLANDIADDGARDRVIQDLQDIAVSACHAEILKGQIGATSIYLSFLLAPETMGLSLVIGGGSYLGGKVLDWSLDSRIEATKQIMIDHGVNFDKPAGTVDKTVLVTLLNEVEQLDRDDYTSASWSRLTDARAKAQLALDDPAATQYQINLAIKWLSSAREFLWDNLSGFDAALAAEGEKKRGIPFDLKITNAKGEYGYPMYGFTVTVTSNLEHGALYNGEANITDGNATVPVTLYTDGEHTLTISVAEVTKPRTLPVTVVVSPQAWEGIITIDDKYDFLPRTDGIRDTWVKKLSATVDVITAGVMYRDESGTRQIGTIEVSARLASPLATIRVEIDGGWVFWQFRNVDANYESWIYNPGTGRAVRLVSALDADVYASSFRFQNSGVLWVDNNQGLMFFNGTETITLADKDDFSDPVFNNGWVVWTERPADAVAWNASHIRLYNGSETLNLSIMGDAVEYIGHFLPCTDGSSVVWKGMKFQNTSVEDIFLYDGVTVQRLTTGNPGPIRHLRFWMDHVVWQHGAYELYLWDGQEKVLITGSLPAENVTSTRRHWDFRQGKVAWHEHLDFDQDNNTGWWNGPAGPIHLYDTAAKASWQVPWAGSSEGEGWSIEDMQFDGRGVFWVTTRFLDDPYFLYRHVLKLFTWNPDRTLTLDEYDDPAGYYYRSFYQSGYAAWARRKLAKEDEENALWWFWTVQDEGGAKRWMTGMLGDAVSPYYDTEIFRYSPDTGTRQITRSNYDPDDAQLEEVSKGRVIWAGLRLPAESELPDVGPNTVSGSIWSQRDSFREIYARNMPVSCEDFLRSALQGLPALVGKPGDPGLSENDFNENGVFDLEDIAYALQRASGLR